jgi:hypothetical protein
MSLAGTIKPAASDSFRYPHPFRDMTVQGSDDGVNNLNSFACHTLQFSLQGLGH